jgi:lipopolysaccharide biosynthesis protein
VNSPYRRALILAHYDPDGLVDPHVMYSLSEYRKAFSHITVVSVSAKRLPAEHEYLADTFIARNNIGYDFLSWKIGYDALGDKEAFFEIAFANDSVYGPLFDIEHVLAAPAVKEADFWGMTSSFERTWHIQSFFFAMRQRLLNSGLAQKFWDEIASAQTKRETITRYELSMANFFRERGWKTAAIYNAPQSQSLGRILRLEITPAQPWRSIRNIYGSLRYGSGAPNPMHHRCSFAIQAGVPFVKVELMRSNPHQLRLKPILKFIKRNSRYPSSLIDAHIQRTQGWSLPIAETGYNYGSGGP